jgi:anaerobic magnesium-protoporphyrin IX monomethyl ester cyclase
VKVSLIFPPVTDPRAPHLALPSLAAVLRAANVQTSLIDLDLEGLLHVVSGPRLEQAAFRLARTSPATDRARRLLRRAVHLPEEVSRALSSLRDPQRFYDAHAYNDARAALGDALELVSIASAQAGYDVRYDILDVQYEVRGADPAVLADLIRVTGERRLNLFADHWEEDLFPRLIREQPDLVGVSISNRQQIIPGLTLARALRERGHFVVLGGTVFTKFADALGRRPAFFEHFADAVVLYEGETALLALLEQLQTGRDFSRVPNLLYLERGMVRATATHVEDVASLPVPDFEGLPLDNYLAPARVLPILTGKGCYFNRCKFCDIPYINHVSRKPYRVRPPERVAADCLALEARFGCRHFIITDEALSPKLLDGFADALLATGRNDLSFVGYARLEKGFSRQLCQKLSRVGFRKLFFGLESGHQATLDHMNKGIDVADAPVVLGNLRAAEINFHVFSIVGFPEEPPESAEATFRFFVDNASIIDHPGNSFDVHPFGLELRTQYYAEAKQMGVVISPRALSRDFVIGLRDEHWSSTRGMNGARARQLIAEYTEQLRKVFDRYHNCPEQLWPGYEEYAVLYGDRYRRHPFTFRTSVPESDQTPHRVCLAATVDVDQDGGTVQLQGRHGSMALSRTTCNWLLANRFVTVAQQRALFFRAGVESVPQVLDRSYRDLVARLAARGLVRVEIQNAGPAAAWQPGVRAAHG